MRKTVITVALAAGVLATAAACGGGSSSSGPGGKTHSVSQTEQQGAIGAKLDLSKLSPSIKDPSSPVTDTLRAGFNLPGSRTTVQLFLDRRHGAFSDRDVAVLRMLHPALDRAVRMQRAGAERTTELSDAERIVGNLHRAR